MIGARVFVLILFSLLGASFLAGTAALIWEFRESGWVTLATHDSHLFLFFPTLGIVALAAFYRPSYVFVDMYWRHVKLGRVRFVLGFVALAACSYWVAQGLAESRYKSVWDLNPATLAADKREPAGCGPAGPACERLKLIEAIQNVGTVSRERFGVRDFLRHCESEPLIEKATGGERKRYCFASTPLSSSPRLSDDAECCQAQGRFQSAIVKLHEAPAHRSFTGKVHALLLPLKVFFLLMLLLISILLALRHEGVQRHYPDRIARIEVGVIVGAVAMVFFPLMSQAFVQTADALYGVRQETGFRPIVDAMSVAFGAWALLLVLFFFRRHTPEVELAAKLAGVVASTVAVIKFDLIVALFARFLGAGADESSIAFLVFFAVFAVLILLSPFARQTLSGDEEPNKT
jgi:hypothetical protein